ncbi:hypothetical protein ACFQS7_28760 [Dankookia sp. GCM10030260]|uniref:hypothetical protein n=1 Tax=Dankookia sp. GCM10030260 TaxID=3273390 RepID=UPI0036196AED
MELGARRVAPLYGSVDPEAHRPVPPEERLRADLSYLGTYAANGQPVLERLLVAPARRLPQRRFVVGGALYPAEFPWSQNIWFLRHVRFVDIFSTADWSIRHVVSYHWDFSSVGEVPCVAHLFACAN